MESHYDVVDAHSAGWNSDPFTLTGLDGYLYGRGVSDDKGPILAVAFAAAELLQQRSLEVDIVLLIEGEEEIGSPGLENAIRTHKVMMTNIRSLSYIRSLQNLIGHIDAILVRFVYPLDFNHVIQLCSAAIRLGSQMTRLVLLTV
jgi:di- and tripeptidase